LTGHWLAAQAFSHTGPQRREHGWSPALDLLEPDAAVGGRSESLSAGMYLVTPYIRLGEGRFYGSARVAGSGGPRVVGQLLSILVPAIM
jgi:hypothetical protein